ncbi:hypothetical protein C8N28_0664 [Albibacterium bauzanense]|uniref:Uncharacterized protein n=1 Tax=Albibacterium bauzanense TaxID=653929 RepID=A0A4R1M0E4_9SPHI|nr:hypothetical protein C8N28_0664 [Albibacterium bauzanense]
MPISRDDQEATEFLFNYIFGTVFVLGIIKRIEMSLIIVDKIS